MSELRGAAAALLLALGGCADAPVGSRERPFRMYFVPSVEADKIAVSADAIGEFVAAHVSRELYGEEGRFHVETAIPASYIAVVEAFGTGRADFAALNTFSFILARDVKHYDVEPIVTVVRGEDEHSYKGQILARADSGIESLQDLRGKRFAYTDPASTAGYVLPRALLRREGIELGETMFAMKHDNVVTQVYQGQVDAGATYYSPPAVERIDGREVEVLRDARARVLTQFPDVAEKVRIVAFTMETPNAPWVIRGGIHDDPAEQARLREAVRAALLAFAATPEGNLALDELYDVTGLAEVDDAAYDEIREMVLELGVDLAGTLQ